MLGKCSDYGQLWAYILPDGIRFCHWGGKQMSARLINMLKVSDTDTVLELCCGQGGTLKLVPTARLIVGVDISSVAIAAAGTYLSRQIVLLQADVRQLPLSDESYSKVFAQDGDAWLHPAKHATMSEVFRVTAKNGLFIYQSYCSSSMPEDALRHTEKVLRNYGFIYTDVPRRDEVQKMFQCAGFRIESVTPLHHEYSRDNLRMLERLNANRDIMDAECAAHKVETLGELLEWEKKLFSEGWWSGILVTARKDGGGAKPRWR